MANTLSEANYQSRRINLGRQIAEAQERHHTVAFALELGQATTEDLAAAKADLDLLESRLTGLDAAWERRSKEHADEQHAAEIASRHEAHAAATKILGRRVKAAEKLEHAAKALADAHAAYEQTGADILAAVAPVASHLGRDGVGHLREEATGAFGSPAFLVAGLLKEHGLDFSGIDPDAARFRLQDVGIVPFVEAHNANIARRLVDLLPAESEA